MFKEEDNYYFIEELRSLGIEARYGNKKHGIEEIEKVTKIKKLIHGVQTHSSNIAIVDERIDLVKIPFQDCDGMITNRKDLLLYTKHADCLAIFFYDRVNKVIGICHSGWKGSFDEISKNLIDKMKIEYNSNLEDIIIGIGIGISKKNYEVDKKFYEMFKEKFQKNRCEKNLNISEKDTNEKYTDTDIDEKNLNEKKDILEVLMGESFEFNEGKIYFDNEKFNFHLFRSYGVKKENIILSNLCTYEDEKFNSYRKTGKSSGRNLAYMYIK